MAFRNCICTKEKLEDILRKSGNSISYPLSKMTLGIAIMVASTCIFNVNVEAAQQTERRAIVSNIESISMPDYITIGNVDEKFQKMFLSTLMRLYENSEASEIFNDFLSNSYMVFFSDETWEELFSNSPDAVAFTLYKGKTPSCIEIKIPENTEDISKLNTLASTFSHELGHYMFSSINCLSSDGVKEYVEQIIAKEFENSSLPKVSYTNEELSQYAMTKDECLRNYKAKGEEAKYYYFSSPSEYLAECFSNYIMKNESYQKDKETCPETYRFIESVIRQYGEQRQDTEILFNMTSKEEKQQNILDSLEKFKEYNTYYKNKFVSYTSDTLLVLSKGNIIEMKNVCDEPIEITRGDAFLQLEPGEVFSYSTTNENLHELCRDISEGKSFSVSKVKDSDAMKVNRKYNIKEQAVWTINY